MTIVKLRKLQPAAPPQWHEAGPCPRCGSAVDMDIDCPGYRPDAEGYATLMCASGCSNAVLYRCESDDCDWWYRSPNRRKGRPGNPMGEQPSWPLNYGW